MNYQQFIDEVLPKITIAEPRAQLMFNPQCYFSKRTVMAKACKGRTCTIVAPKILHNVWEEDIKDSNEPRENFMIFTPHTMRYGWEDLFYRNAEVLIVEFDCLGPSTRSTFIGLLNQFKVCFVRNLVMSRRIYDFLTGLGFKDVVL